MGNVSLLNEANLIHCSKILRYGGIEGNSHLNMKRVYLLTVGLMFFSSLIYAYSSYVHSRDGSSVACGGEYSSYVHSRDGSSVCAGGRYSSYVHSRDGSDVAAGGEYSSYVHSRDGSSVACGGEYSSYVHSRDGSSVCAGWVSN